MVVSYRMLSEVEKLEKYTVKDHLPGVFLNGTIAVSRMPALRVCVWVRTARSCCCVTLS